MRGCSVVVAVSNLRPFMWVGHGAARHDVALVDLMLAWVNARINYRSVPPGAAGLPRRGLHPQCPPVAPSAPASKRAAGTLAAGATADSRACPMADDMVAGPII